MRPSIIYIVGTMEINNRTIGSGRAYIIADVGSNYNGSLDLAREYIRLGGEIGVDAVKFQSYRAETLLSPVKPDGKQWEAYGVVKKYELPPEWLGGLFEYAEHEGVEFLTTPFDTDILDVLDKTGMRAFKVASGDLTFVPLLAKIAGYGKPVILSTGMSHVEEVNEAIGILRDNGALDIALLHCASNYPPAYRDVNLRAIETMAGIFNVPVGLSDHTADDVTAIGAVTLGASIIEKHITIDNGMGTPDAPFAMTVEGFGRMVRNIRNLERALGDGVKRPTENENNERQWARRGVYAKRDILADEALADENVKFVRPVNGLAASAWERYRGKMTVRHINRDEPLRKEDIFT